MRLPGLSKGHWLLFALALLIALVASLPLRLAVGWAASDTRGLGARGVHGSIWGGTIEQMRVGALPLGTLDAALSPLPLLLGRVRSEEHTSELQSLMRISYAVFCLKKTKKLTQLQT